MFMVFGLMVMFLFSGCARSCVTLGVSDGLLDGVTGRGATTATRPWCCKSKGGKSGDAGWTLVVIFVAGEPLIVEAFVCVVLFFKGGLSIPLVRNLQIMLSHPVCRMNV